MNKEYTLEELIKSTQARIQYNVQLSVDAMQRGDFQEGERFQKNVVEMMKSIEEAIFGEQAFGNGKDCLIGNRDW